MAGKRAAAAAGVPPGLLGAAEEQLAAPRVRFRPLSISSVLVAGWHMAVESRLTCHRTGWHVTGASPEFLRT